MAKYPAQLQSANLNEFGIVYADEVQGHKTVANLDALYAITDPILSKSVKNTGNDAIGQEWYVISEGCYYRLDNWANRRQASGWTKLQVVDTEFDSLSTHGADKIKDFTTSPDDVTLNYNTWKSSTVSQDGSAKIPAATQTAAGILTAADKKKLDGLNTDSINKITVDSDATKATITYKSDNGIAEDTSTSIEFPAATSTKAGTMSAKDKEEFDRVETTNFALGAVTPAADNVGVAATKTNIADGSTVQNNITIPAATKEKAGVMSAADKTKLEGLNANSVSEITVDSDASKATITYKSDNGESEDTSTTINFPVASTTKAGTISAAEYVKLTETLPNAINKEIQDRKDADTALQEKLDKEILDRTNADNALQEKLNKEVQDRTEADTALDTKLSKKISDLEAKHDAFVATKGQANGFAPLDGSGLIPSTHLPSYVDDIIDVFATYKVGPTGGLTDIKLYSDSGHLSPVTGESGKIYVNVTPGEPSYQFRWSGSAFVDSNTSSLIIGEIAGTAFDGARGKAVETTVQSLPNKIVTGLGSKFNQTATQCSIDYNFATKEDGGVYKDYNLDSNPGNTSNIPIPAATSTLAGVMSAADKVNLDTTIPGKISEETKNRQDQIRSISGELGFNESPTNTFNFSPTNKDLADKDTVTKAIDFLADEKYRSEMPDSLTVPTSIGGLKAGKSAKELKTKSISQILDDILFPELQPTIVAPSASIAFKAGFSNGQILEKGATAPVNPDNFTTGYSQGSSKVVGQADKKRGGVLVPGGSFIFYGGNPETKTLPAKVELGTMSYKYRASYQQGEECITSKGNKASVVPNPLPAGTVDSGAITVHGTLPYFSNGLTASSTAQDTSYPGAMTDAKLPLVKWETTLIGAKFASEATTGTRITFDFPSTKRVTKVEFMNTVSGKWENFAGFSTASLGEKTVQGAQVAYSRLTTTGALSGAIQLRFTVAG